MKAKLRLGIGRSKFGNSSILHACTNKNLKASKISGWKPCQIGLKVFATYPDERNSWNLVFTLVFKPTHIWFIWARELKWRIGYYSLCDTRLCTHHLSQFQVLASCSYFRNAMNRRQLFVLANTSPRLKELMWPPCDKSHRKTHANYIPIYNWSSGCDLPSPDSCFLLVNSVFLLLCYTWEYRRNLDCVVMLVPIRCLLSIITTIATIPCSSCTDFMLFFRGIYASCFLDSSYIGTGIRNKAFITHVNNGLAESICRIHSTGNFAVLFARLSNARVCISFCFTNSIWPHRFRFANLF